MMIINQKSSNGFNDSIQMNSYLFRKLLNSSMITIVLTIGIFFNMIQLTNSNIILSNLVGVSTSNLPISTTSSPLIPSYYSSLLSSTSGRFIRPGSSAGIYYYQAIQIRVSVNGKYTFSSTSSIDTYGCFYSDDFYSSYPSQNLIAYDDDSGGSGQFRINVTLSNFRSYILVVTTYAPSIIGSFSITALGPASLSFFPYVTTTIWPTSTTSSPLIPSYYSGILSISSGIFTRPGGSSDSNYYYQAIEISTYTNGRYTFSSTSSIDTYGCFYSVSFNPSNPSQNLISCDDDSGGSGQFRINVTLLYGNTYILVVTTYSPNIIGSFSITGLGPSSVSLTPLSPTSSTFSGSLTMSSQKFARPGLSSNNYYFQAIQITIYTSGTYTLISESTIDTYGYLYRDYVDPSYPYRNLIASDDDSGGNRQFRIIYSLQSGTTYVLLVTTFSSYTIGNFLVRVSGPSSVNLIGITPKPSYIGPNVLVITIIIITSIMFFTIIFGLCLRRRYRQRNINVLRPCNQYIQPSIYSTPPITTTTTRLNGGYLEKPPPSYNSIIKDTTLRT